MAWFKVDDGFHDHPKVDNLSLEAIGLWIMCATWSSRHLTDGVVPFARIVKLGGNAELCSELVRANMWRTSEDVRDDGSPNTYEYVNWGDWNPTKDDVQEDRKKARERMKNLRSKQSDQGKRSGEQTANKRRTSEDVRDPVPSRPVPFLINGQPTVDLFDDFWEIYPRRVKKKDAQEKFKKVVKDGVKPETIIEGAKAYAESVQGKDPEHIAHPTSWLSQGRWEDEVELNTQQERMNPWSNAAPRANGL